jgi:transcriptional regulator with XRE-family HTH domain
VTEVPKKAPGPTGPAYPVKVKWQEEVRARLKQRGMSQADLAKLCSCTQPAINAVLRPGAKQSALVPAISKALGMRKPADPSVETTDPVRAELAELLDEMSDEAAAVMLANARLLTGSKKPE